MAALVAWLLSDESSYVTGGVFSVDGDQAAGQQRVDLPDEGYDVSDVSVATKARERIRRRWPLGTSPRIAIIGGGWGGIIAAVKLKQRGICFVIFEREDEPGGVWYANTFPGLGVDVPAHLYSFSFKRHYDWSRTHPMRDEILRYTNEIIDEWGLRPHFRLRTTVSRVRWCETQPLFTRRR